MALTELAHAGGFILSVASGNRSFENGTLNEAQDLAAGTVVGRLLAAGAAAAVGTPTGNGAITVGAIGADAVAGEYSLVCVAAATNAGTFNFLAPDGTLVRQITAGAGPAANSHIVITIADGATDFVAGDTWTITVTAGDYEALDPAEDDGAQIATGILYAAVDATGGDKACVIVARDAECNANEITWPSGISAGNKAIAIAQLNARGIFLR